MAVIYTLDDGDSITIGGTSSTGPFPKFSISRNTVETGDGTGLNNTYNITVVGTVLTPSSGDITDSGDMQSKLQLEIITKLQLNANLGHNVGKLEIVPYGGKPNTIEFLDARLISVDIPEQDDNSAGVLSSGYTFVFEASEDISNSLNTIFPYNLKSAEESWDIQVNEDQLTHESNPNDTPHRTYTITHTVSANAGKKFTTGPSFSKSGWKEAAEWVKTRVVSSPASAIITDAIGNTEFSSFSGTYFDTSSDTLSVDLSSFGFYNHTRTPSVGLFDGSYSITETWVAAQTSATLEMEVEAAQDNQEIITMSLSGTITGLDSSSLNDSTVDKYSNADTIMTYVDTNAFTICNSYYSGSETLSNVPLSKTITRNKGAGTITFNYTYNDIPVLVDNAISTSLRLTDDNENHVTKILAVIPIISKTGGPVIQDMNTSNEQKRSVQMDVLMRRDYRSSKPSSARTVALSYAPTNGRLTTHTENWEPNTGTYSITAEWTY